MSAAVSSVDFGAGWSCVDDVTQPAVMVSGNRIVGEALARRLGTPRGALIDDANYGYDLSQYLNDDLAPADLARIQAAARAECLKDERVRDAVVSVVMAGTTMIATITVTTATGPFALVLKVGDLVQVLSVT